ncbi:M23 family metallopeptidase [Sphingomonas nostoxanthinifaciens]|uniref:M23 family metallopeptidase n=1 Tax=Sphingomonas nostoxanthinifaciens TaxID=2872652 RepID=UPI001CC1C993|nr:M23 family metallopeptidase [Sphingomonas nostoxanthinifaciens]UAK23030.1 M23 family metallopeptidase [Sphingomonas nostoxanthinifaciens]
MTRLGWMLLLGFALVIAIFAALVRHGRAPVGVRTPAPAPVAAAGGLVVPVAGVKITQLADSWGDARGGGTRAHHAIDIPAAKGTPVVAAAAGTVEKLFESKDGGHTVYIRRDDTSWQDYYAHLDTYTADLREGVRIRQGQPIGTVGSSGDADPSAPHLHYEIQRMAPGEPWWKGSEINPFPILAHSAS